MASPADPLEQNSRKAPSGNQIHLFQSVPADLDCLGFYGKELCARVTKLRSEGDPCKG